MYRLKKIIQTVRGILREDPNEPQNNEDQKISKHENSRHTRNCLNANIFLQTVKRIEYTVQRFVKLFCVLDKACTVFSFLESFLEHVTLEHHAISQLLCVTLRLQRQHFF